MNRLFSTLMSLLFAVSAPAADLASGEWFVDSDPGHGAGTSFAVASAPTATANVTIPAATMDTLAPGYHLLGVRMLDDSGEWGHVVWRGFHKDVAPESPPSLAGGEWFIDTDPGVGKGAAIPFPSAMTGIVKPLVPAVALNKLSDGYHLLGVRTRDNLSRWGTVVWRGFHIDRSPKPVPHIASAEYRIIRGGKVISTATKAASPTAASVTLAVNHGNASLLPGASYLLQVIPKDVTGRPGHAVYADFTFKPYASGLTLSAGTLAAFVPGTTGYTMTVANGVTSTTLAATLGNPAITLQVNGVSVGSGATSAPIPLAVGANTITVDVTAEDGTTTTTYTLVITRERSSVASLTALALSAGSLSPKFSSGTTTYSLRAANNVTKMMVTPTATDATATVKVNGTVVKSGAASASIPLAVGANAIKVEVTAQNGTTKRTYEVTVFREASSNALLRKLTLKGGKLSKAFAAKRFAYNATVSSTQKSLQIQVRVADPNARITIAGKRVKSGEMSRPIMLKRKVKTVIKIVVTAQDGSKKTYSVTVTKEKL